MGVSILEGKKFDRFVNAMELMALNADAAASSELSWAAVKNAVQSGLAARKYGIGASVVVEHENSMSASKGESTGITAVTVNEAVFLAADSIIGTGVHVFTYHAGVWTYHDEAVSLSAYGITVTGTPADGDEVIITEAYDKMDMDVVSFEDAYRLGSDATVPAMWLQSHWALNALQFDASEAIFVAAEAIPAGTTLHFGIGTNWGTHCVSGKTYQFTLEHELPANGQIVMANGTDFYTWGAPDVNPSSWKAYTFSGPTSITPIDGPLDVTEGSGGTDLGILSSSTKYPTAAGMINNLQVAANGYNRWGHSAMRKWLNSDAQAGGWWTPSSIYDRPPQQLATLKGFMAGLSGDFRAAIQKVKVTTALNTVTDTDFGTSEDTYDYFFLPSLEQEYIAPQASGVEGSYWPYWKDRLGKSSPQAWYQEGTNEKHIRYAIENHSSAQYVRLRSAYRGYGYLVWSVYSAGYVNSNYATTAIRPAPACVIC